MLSVRILSVRFSMCAPSLSCILSVLSQCALAFSVSRILSVRAKWGSLEGREGGREGGERERKGEGERRVSGGGAGGARLGPDRVISGRGAGASGGRPGVCLPPGRDAKGVRRHGLSRCRLVRGHHPRHAVPALGACRLLVARPLRPPRHPLRLRPHLHHSVLHRLRLPPGLSLSLSFSFSHHPLLHNHFHFPPVSLCPSPSPSCAPSLPFLFCSLSLSRSLFLSSSHYLSSSP